MFGLLYNADSAMIDVMLCPEPGCATVAIYFAKFSSSSGGTYSYKE